MQHVKWLGTAIAALLLALPQPVRAATPLHLPAGFNCEVYAADLPGPRLLAISPHGDLTVSCPRAGKVLLLPDRQHRGRPDGVRSLVSGLDLPHGLAWHDGALYIAETGAIRKLEVSADGLLRRNLQTLRHDLPPGGMHWTRTLVFGPDGGMYVSIGSDCNACQEADPRRAAIMRYDAAGRSPQLYATGLRNAVGLAFGPGGVLWATENGRDWLGDNLPPDELNVIEKGANYGWPYCYGDRVPDPQHTRQGFCATTRPPAFKFPAHSASLGLAFYTGKQFPAAYQGDLFVCFHGSWNRSVPTGYKVVRLKFSGGKPVGMTDFVTGFHGWGRPVDAVVAPDGSLFVSDDLGGRILRIRYARSFAAE